MKLAIATLLAALSLSTLVRADVAPQYRVRWTFTELIGYHYEDYSTNLGIPLGATLPVAAVKAGWACVRDRVMWSRGAGIPFEAGQFRCSNGQETAMAYASCKLDQINSDYSWLDLKLPGAEDGIRFQVSCTALNQQ